MQFNSLFSRDQRVAGRGAAPDHLAQLPEHSAQLRAAVLQERERCAEICRTYAAQYVEARASMSAAEAKKALLDMKQAAEECAELIVGEREW